MRAAVFVAGPVLLWTATSLALTPGQVYKKSGPAVLLILGSDGGKSGSAGTGSIITGDGKVITNAHVVVNHQGRPFKTLYGFMKPPKMTGDNSKDLTNRYKLKVLSFSPADELDLAVCELVNAPGDLPTVAFADPDEVEIGDPVVAIGHPESGGLWTLTTGSVSTLIANFGGVKGKNVFQTEASFNRGNSGGPLLDDAGNMIGINTMIARQGAGGVAITDVNFSLKSSVAVRWLAGQGLGLAYAPENAPVTVALAPTQKGSSGASAAKPPPEPKQVTKPPPATIVVAEKPPAEPAEVHKLRAEGTNVGKARTSEQVEAGQRFDPKTAPKPKYHTKKRPFSIDQLRREQMKELEDMMQEMRGVIDSKKKGRGGGMGLW